MLKFLIWVAKKIRLQKPNTLTLKFVEQLGP